MPITCHSRSSEYILHTNSTSFKISTKLFAVTNFGDGKKIILYMCVGYR